MLPPFSYEFLVPVTVCTPSDTFHGNHYVWLTSGFHLACVCVCVCVGGGGGGGVGVYRYTVTVAQTRFHLG